VVQAVLPTGNQAEIEIFMPVWTPGSYLVREYARHVEAASAADGSGGNLAFSKTTRNRWRIQTGGAPEVHFTYSVYCREMSVRTNWVEDSFALLNGAPTFVTLVGGTKRPHDVQLVLPSAWKMTMTGLPESPDGAPHHYLAPDYDTLVDCPILAGNPVVHEFDVDGIPHYLVNQGEESTWDGTRAAGDVAKIVQHYREMWGSLPYRKYVFLNLITELGGGLEHSNSACMMTNRWSTSTRRAYLSWLSLASHEYFHVWNVKRLRPVELGPFDYENENLTRSLWVAEGLTDYYAPLVLHRAGISSQQEYLTGAGNGTSGLSGAINTLQTTPGRLVRSAEQASFDAWIKHYRPDENSVNTSISYYTKGAIVGWLLDATIRKSTGSRKSLDDLMRLAFSRYAGENGYTPEQFKAAAEEVAGVPLKEFFQRTVESTEELDYTEALDWFGLRFKQPSNGTKKAWLGADTRVDSGRLVVTKLLRGTPAYAAGMNVDDEILAFDDYRVRADHLNTRLENYRPGNKISVLVARREKLMRMEVELGEEPSKKWQLEVRPDASPEQKQNLAAWLGNK
jgi:predicted metalloprotease with PDZ domain